MAQRLFPVRQVTFLRRNADLIVSWLLFAAILWTLYAYGQNWRAG